MQWKGHSVVFSLQQYGGSTKPRWSECNATLESALHEAWSWALQPRVEVKCAGVAAAAPSFISSASSWSSEDTKHSVSAMESSYLGILPDSCPHYCPKLPQCGLWAPSRMEGSWPSHWGSASALTKGKLQTSFHPLSPSHCSGDCSCF